MTTEKQVPESDSGFTATRRTFLGNAGGIGGLLALGSGGIVSTALTSSALAADARRTYAASTFLELDGMNAGSLKSAAGGFPFFEQVKVSKAAGVFGKQPGNLRYEPITIQFTAGAGKPLIDWITSA